MRCTFHHRSPIHILQYPSRSAEAEVSKVPSPFTFISHPLPHRQHSHPRIHQIKCHRDYKHKVFYSSLHSNRLFSTSIKPPHTTSFTSFSMCDPSNIHLTDGVECPPSSPPLTAIKLILHRITHMIQQQDHITHVNRAIAVYIGYRFIITVVSDVVKQEIDIGHIYLAI